MRTTDNSIKTQLIGLSDLALCEYIRATDEKVRVLQSSLAAARRIMKKRRRQVAPNESTIG